MLMFDGSLAKKIGLHEAIILQKIVYWQQKYPEKEWIYNSYQNWSKQFEFLSPRIIQRACLSLKRLGFLKVKKTGACNFYQVDKLVLEQAVSEAKLFEHSPSMKEKEDSNKTSFVEHAYKELEDLSEAEVSIQQDSKSVNVSMQMLEIWEQRIPTPGQTLTLTEHRENKLESLLAGTFNFNMQRWEEFVDAITKSDFLMGRVANTTFKISLDWAIKPENCLRILEGIYANKDDKDAVAIEVTPVQLEANVNANIAEIEDRNWKETAILLVRILGHATYWSWITKTKFIKQENKRIYLEAKSKFIAEWIEDHYCHKIRHAWNQATNGDISGVVITTSHEFEAENHVNL